jgi:hypothetical protein
MGAAAHVIGLPPPSSPLHLMPFPSLHTIRSPPVPIGVPAAMGLDTAVPLPPSIAPPFGSQLPGAPVVPDLGFAISGGGTWPAQQPHAFGAQPAPLPSHSYGGDTLAATTNDFASSGSRAFLGALESPSLQQTMQEADSALQAAAMASSHGISSSQYAMGSPHRF